MNMNDLMYFQQVNTYRSFTLTAKMLGVTQPTVSEAISRLEKSLNTKLFYRTKQGITLTPQGKLILEKTSLILNTKNEIESLANINTQIQLNIKIGCHPVIGRYFLSKFLKQSTKKYPQINFKLHHDNSRSVQQMIQNGEIDIGVVVNPIRNPDLFINRITFDKVMIWKSTSNQTPNNQLIADFTLPQTHEILRQWKSAPTQHIHTNDFNLIGDLVESNMAYGILPERFVQMEKLKVENEQKSLFVKDEFCVVYRPEFLKNSYSKECVQFIINSFS